MKVALKMGPSRGLNAAIAQALAPPGGAVEVNCAHDGARDRRTLDSMAVGGGVATLGKFDVTDPHDVKAGSHSISREQSWALYAHYRAYFDKAAHLSQL